MKNFKRVAVLMGGTSTEREVSLVSGQNVVEALTSLGRYEVIPIVLDADDLSALPAEKVDACFLALHGGWGEDGGVQRALDDRHICYTGAGARGCQMSMDKQITKRTFDDLGVASAYWKMVTMCDADLPADKLPVPLPCVVKTLHGGSSIGVYRVDTYDQWAPAVRQSQDIEIKRTGRTCFSLVESFIPGREMTVSVLNGKALPVIEICTPNGWYGYEEKYNSDATRYEFPTDDFLPKMQEIAVRVYHAFQCRGLARVDFRVTDKGEMYALEVNTSPGMTSHSLAPKAAAKAGIEFPELCEQVLQSSAYGS